MNHKELISAWKAEEEIAYIHGWDFSHHLFHQKGARRIYAFTEDYNLSSQSLCKKRGMQQEGLFREFVSSVNDADGNPIYENTMQRAILKKERNEGRILNEHFVRFILNIC